MHAFEAILRMCAATAPQPWYPRLYAQSVGMSQASLYRYLEDLWLDGLVQKAEGSPETGPGLTLTPAGLDVLNDPAALQRLTEGRAVKPGDQGGAVREAYRRRTRPTATLGVIAVNAAAFLYTVYLASRLGIVPDFIGLSPFGGANPAVAQRIENVIIQAGAVYGGGWLKGEWWLLLTSCFIHIGAMHILANMYALYRVGGEVERMWGSVRYLVIYLFAGLGGSCLALGLAPREVMAGASGAICGVLGAEAVWVLCNGRHLPRSLARELRRNLLINGVLITFISLMPGVSWQGHLGGALTGAAVALVMQVQRFGPSPLRWPILFALVPLPWAGYAFIKHQQATNPEWAQAAVGPVDPERSKEEKAEFQTNYLKRIQMETYAALATYQNAGVLDLAPEDRKPADVDKVKHDLGEQREIMKQLAADLAKAGPYQDPKVETARRKGLRLAEALEDLLTTAEKRLREGEEWTKEDQSKSQQVDEAIKEWRNLLKK
jgi:membrane associated rhomboid family serine protease